MSANLSQGERRLAAIMFTDMAGYTSLSERNEALAMELLEEHRKLLRPLFPKHGGREVKTIGDAFLVEFNSALEAVRCAFDIQESLHEVNSGRPTDRRLSVRIGINLGDIIGSGTDVYGDAVNVASRVEPLAQPGGICVTEQVYRQVKNKFEFPLRSLGKKELKNVGEPVEVFRVALPWEKRDTVESMLDKHRIAVLPFSSLSPDPSDEFFADGLTEELISRLCQVRDLEVIARTSVMSYKKTEKKIAEIAGELKVGSLVEGSVRKAGNKIRVTAQLIDPVTEGHLWASSYDKTLDDIFAVQSDIAGRLTEALRVELLPNEKGAIERKATESTVAYTLYLKGRYDWNERNPSSVKHAIGYFEKAIEIDPKFALAYVGLADCYLVLSDQSVIDTKEALQKAKPLLDKALEHDASLAEAHASLGNMFTEEWNWSRAEEEYKRAIELNPNYATSHHWYSILLQATGRSRQALDEVMAALSLDPLSPIINANVGINLLRIGSFEEGIERLKRTLTLEPGFELARGHLGAAYIAMARYDEGIAELQAVEASRANPWLMGFLGYGYALKDDEVNARRVLSELEGSSKSRFVPSALLGTIYFALGEKDKAFSLMERSFEERSTALPYIRSLAIYREIQADPRFKSLLDKMLSGARPER